jgi:hypothetical protein
VNDNLSRVKAELKSLKAHKAHFSSLPTLQKLQLLSTKQEGTAEVSALKALTKSLAVQVDYAAAVRSAVFPME